jgi:hypothetical protein
MIINLYTSYHTLQHHQTLNTGLENEASMRQFSEKDKNYFAYQARQNYLRQQMSIYGELDETRQAKNNALHQLDLVSAERDALALREQQALEEIEKLKALLAAKQS